MRYICNKPMITLHAEISCLLQIKDLDIDFNKVKLYIYREDKNGNLAISRPCGACMKLIDKLGIKTIYYTIDGGYIKEIRDNKVNKNKENIKID